MKKSTLFFAALLCMMMQSVSTFAGDKLIPTEQLPAAAMAFIQENFPGEGVMFAKKDFDNGRRQYEVHLNNGVQLDFDKKGNWDKVDCQFNAVPAHLVPTVIANYVQTSYPGSVVVKIDKERYGYKIELSNDLEMKFNKQGALFDIDD
ncbi:MAG: PepSY-like domain-containing protein [Prevotella sp.]|nr:PepSY-like domain-containing protein [Prevotella sp.]